MDDPGVAAARLALAHLNQGTLTEAIMVLPQDIKQYIEANLTCERVEVSGDGHHFEALVVSPLFSGKSRVAQHQLVYQALGDRMREEIHALSMRTLTPDQWAALGDH